MPQIRLSVLDQAPVREGGTASDAFRESVALAQEVERLGFHRYWIAEHHGTDGLASGSPEILITHVAAATKSIRIGSGGVMLSHYSPYKVAELFRMLEALHPGRIDLGIGRAPGTDMATAMAIAYGNPVGAEQFPNKVNDLLGFLTRALPPEHPLRRARVTPETPGMPAVWVLGSSEYSATLAGHFGLPFSYAHFIEPRAGDQAMQLYFRQFKPNALFPEPEASVGIFVLCAETEEEVERLAASRDLWRLRVEQGIHGPVPSPETAQAYPYTGRDRERIPVNRRRMIMGTPDQVREQIEALTARYGVNEVVVLTITYDFAARIRSYQLLAEAFGLQPRAAA